jgi:hypothetical protein
MLEKAENTHRGIPLWRRKKFGNVGVGWLTWAYSKTFSIITFFCSVNADLGIHKLSYDNLTIILKVGVP